MTDNELFIFEHYHSVLNMARDNKHLTESAYHHLSSKLLTTLDEMEAANKELIHFLQHSAYYRLLERIENGERMRDEETDKAKRDYYSKILDGLYAELELHMPKEEAA